VVYAISCVQCKKVIYVGETERSVGERMQEHMRDVRTKTDKPINVHFNDGQHNPDTLSFSVLEKLYSAGRIERQLKEVEWICKLHTARPDGWMRERERESGEREGEGERERKGEGEGEREKVVLFMAPYCITLMCEVT
jgi:hypothetical protein